MRLVVHPVRMTGESLLYSQKELSGQYETTVNNLYNGINYHIKDPILKMCMRREAIVFLDGIQDQWVREPKSDTEINTHEYMAILDEVSKAGAKFFSEGLTLGDEALSLFSGASQIIAGVGLLATPAWPLGLVLVYQGVGNTGGGISTLINQAAGTHYDWNVTKKLDEILLGKKAGDMTFDAMDLGSSIKGLMRLELKTNEFGMPILKLFRKDPINYIREFKNMAKWGLRVELLGDFSTAGKSYRDFK